ncbi:MAG: TetR/AcrR family transcriptional regulator [Vulcanimicrobiaceae bacterium]|jgi:TetR/AcrR family transcriptional repressor of nem operon
MPWSPEHKPETRARILDAAAAAFRERGVAEVGLAEIMRSAGLTHGGFYGHFRSKDELVAATVPHAAQDSEASLARMARDAAPQDVLGRVEAYLSPEHREHPERGCQLAANGPELTRGTRSVRAALAVEVRRRLHALIDLCPGRRAAVARRQAAGALACMIGGMILARAVPEAESAAILADVRAFARDALAAID